MREFTSPLPATDVSPDENLTTSLWESVKADPHRPAVAYRDGDQFEEWTLGQFVDEVRAVARGLIGLGIEPGDRVSIFSSTRLEWTVADYAIWAAGGVTVPLYETSSADQVEWILSDSGTRAIVIESEELQEQYQEVADRLPDCRHAFVFDEGGLDAIKDAGSDVPDDAVQQRADALTGEDLATIVYTSGTTGPPKGCELTHGNFTWSVAQTQAALEELLKPGKTTLLFLPLAHIFSRVIQVVCIRTGVVLGFASDMDEIREELPMFAPSFLLAVPRVFDKVYAGAQRQAHEDRKGPIFERAATVAQAHAEQQESDSESMWTGLQHKAFDRLVYDRLRAALGGQVEYAVSGGGALGEQMARFFTGIGITVLEGYGLTETTAPATVNRPDATRIGTVGQPLPGVTVRIDDDGEVLVRGGNVFRGYHDNPDATAEVLEDGWLRSEDLGELDDDGYLTITGRKKDLIVTAAGKNVAPAVLEDRLRTHPLISQSMVVGDGRPFISALVTLDPEELEAWAAEHDRSAPSLEEAAEDSDIRSEIEQAVEEANEVVSRPERIREFRIVPDEFTLEEDELTPTMKVKRDVVEEHYEELIDDIYADV